MWVTPTERKKRTFLSSSSLLTSRTPPIIWSRPRSRQLSPFSRRRFSSSIRRFSSTFFHCSGVMNLSIFTWEKHTIIAFWHTRKIIIPLSEQWGYVVAQKLSFINKVDISKIDTVVKKDYFIGERNNICKIWKLKKYCFLLCSHSALVGLHNMCSTVKIHVHM